MDDFPRSYRVLDEAGAARAYKRLAEEDLLWAFEWQYDAPTLEQWMAVYGPHDTLLLEGYVDGVPGGLLSLIPAMTDTRCGMVGVTAYRNFFPCAERLVRGACLWVFEHLDCASLLGVIPAANHHALRMVPRVGFSVLGRVPGMCWYARKQQFVDGVLVVATPESVKQSEV